jgi:hypothetical protein
MPFQLHDLGSLRVLELERSGPPIGSERDAVELVGQAAENKAEMIALPSERLAASFFELKTRIAGEMTQKFSMYGVRLAVVGDISVRESNRGNTIWFVATIDELKQRLLAAK